MNVMEGVAEKKAVLDRYNELAMNYSEETADEMAALQDKIDSQNLWDLESQVEQAMDALGCPPGDADVGPLSGGEKRRVALCKLLLWQPELLLLDEPTNHLDAETVHWLENHLREYPGAILIVTHDRYFLDNVTGWILELDRGHGIPYEGNYSVYLEKKAKRLEQEGREEAARQRAIAREREWIQASPKARQTKSKARIQALRRTAQAQSRPRAGRRPDRHSAGRAPRRHRHRGRRPVQCLRRPPSHRRAVVQAAARRIVGVIGPNGAGKSTLFKMITVRSSPIPVRSASATPSTSAMSTSRATRSIRTRPSGRKSPAATRSSPSASAR